MNIGTGRVPGSEQAEVTSNNGTVQGFLQKQVTRRGFIIGAAEAVLRRL